MKKPFHYEGSIEETALPEMFFTIFRHRVPGLLDIGHEDVRKRIYISDGNVLFASSTDRTDRLGAYLYRKGKISREALEQTIVKRERAGAKHGQILIEEGLLSPAELYQAIRGQMEAIVWSVFSWQSGHFSFKLGDFTEPTIRIHLPLRQVIIRGIQRAPEIKSMVARLGKKHTVLRPVYCTEDLIEVALERNEYKLLRLVDGQRSIYDICTQGPFSVSENARLLYAFHVLNLVEVVPPEATRDTNAIKIKLDADRKVHV